VIIGNINVTLWQAEFSEKWVQGEEHCGLRMEEGIGHRVRSSESGVRRRAVEGVETVETVETVELAHS
jgi:hypothetical protein